MEELKKLMEKYKDNFELGVEYEIDNLKLIGNESKKYTVIRTDKRFMFFTDGELVTPSLRPFKNIEDLKIDHNITAFETVCRFFNFDKQR